LALGREAENFINNPFGPDAKVEWLMDGNVASEDFFSGTDEKGTLTLKLWPEQDSVSLELECKNEDGKTCQYLVSSFRVPTTLEIEKGEWGEIDYPGDLWNPVSGQITSKLVELDIASNDSCYRVKGLEPGYEDIKLSFENGRLGTVRVNVCVRIFEQSVYKTTTDVPSFQGNCFVAVYKKGEQSQLQTLQVPTTGSITVGKASASAPGYAEIDLKPFLSKEAELACSRRQLKIMMTKDNKLCVENTGSVPVRINDKYDLEPSLLQEKTSGLNQSQSRSLAHLHPDTSITIADEIVLFFKDEIKGV